MDLHDILIAINIIFTFVCVNDHCDQLTFCVNDPSDQIINYKWILTKKYILVSLIIHKISSLKKHGFLDANILEIILYTNGALHFIYY